MTVSHLGQSDSPTRATDLAGHYTATELAKLAADLEAQLVDVRVRLGKRDEALREIARGGRNSWSAEGCRRIAREALDAR